MNFIVLSGKIFCCAITMVNAILSFGADNFTGGLGWISALLGWTTVLIDEYVIKEDQRNDQA